MPLSQSANHIRDLGVVGVDSKSASYMESDEPPLREHSFFSKLHLNPAVSVTTLTFNIFGIWKHNQFLRD